MTPQICSKPANAAVLWTGGKDSALALHEAPEHGFHVRCLLTFAPPNPDFLAHPIPVMKLQAEALGLPHHVWPVQDPVAESYEAGLRWLRTELDIHTVITGDIAEVAGAPNWIRERSRPVGINVHTPLWGRDRLTLLRQLQTARFKVIFSCVKTRWLPADWTGRELDATAIQELQTLRAQNGLDLCGEEGEYHTLVTHGPGFQARLNLGPTQIRHRESLAHLEISTPTLQK